jgi:hypothetical protein
MNPFLYTVHEIKSGGIILYSITHNKTGSVVDRGSYGDTIANCESHIIEVLTKYRCCYLTTNISSLQRMFSTKMLEMGI